MTGDTGICAAVEMTGGTAGLGAGTCAAGALDPLAWGSRGGSSVAPVSLDRDCQLVATQSSSAKTRSLKMGRTSPRFINRVVMPYRARAACSSGGIYRGGFLLGRCSRLECQGADAQRPCHDPEPVELRQLPVVSCQVAQGSSSVAPFRLSSGGSCPVCGVPSPVLAWVVDSLSGRSAEVPVVVAGVSLVWLAVLWPGIAVGARAGGWPRAD